jgi:hypothetical protein
MPKHKYFSSDIVFNESFEAIEADKGIIRGVKVCSEGDIRGHGVYANAKFIRDVTRFGKEHGPGVKARFGHPNMCATALGTYLGRYQNYRTQIEEKEGFPENKRHHAIADLHLDETAKNLPQLGNAWEYIINLAQTSPDMFGNSIVFTPGENELVTEKDEEGKTKVIREDATIEALHATDLVDEPAAVEGLFSRFADEDMAMQVTYFFDQHPEVYELAINHPDIVDTFLEKYKSYKIKKEMSKKSKDVRTIFDKMKDAFLSVFKIEGQEETNIPKEVTDRMSEFDNKLKELETENDSLSNELKEIQDSIAEKDVKIQELTDSNVKKDSEIIAKQAEIEGKESEINQLKAKSTKVPGKKGAEDIVPELTPEDKALNATLKSLRDELSVVRTDDFSDVYNKDDKKPRYHSDN